MKVTHTTVATGTNDPTKQVSKDAWNAEHTIIEDATSRTVTDEEKATWNAKQNALVADTDYLRPSTAASTYESKKGAGDLYVTTTEKNTWNSKQDSLTANVDYLTPETASSAYEPKKGIDDNYVTASEKSTWSAKQDALIADTDYLTPSTAASTYEPKKGADDNYVTDAEKAVIGNTSGVNTGDQDLSGKVDVVAGKGLSANDFTDALATKLNGIEANANNFSLPTATADTLGGVKVGSGLSISDGVLSATLSCYGRVLISSLTLESDGSFDISNISSVYDHLEWDLLVKSNATAHRDLFLYLNNDTTTANYLSIQHYGGDIHNIQVQSSYPAAGWLPYYNSTYTWTRISGRITFIQSAVYKVVESTTFARSGAATGLIVHRMTHWANTEAVTRLTFQSSSDSLKAGSKLMLYGLRSLP